MGLAQVKVVGLELTLVNVTLEAQRVPLVHTCSRPP